MSPLASVKKFINQLKDTLVLNGLGGGDTPLAPWIGGALGLYLVIACGLGIHWSQTPDSFDVIDNSQRYAGEHNQPVVTGTATTAALLQVITTLLEKPGGYPHNDIT